MYRIFFIKRPTPDRDVEIRIRHHLKRRRFVCQPIPITSKRQSDLLDACFISTHSQLRQPTHTTLLIPKSCLAIRHIDMEVVPCMNESYFCPPFILTMSSTPNLPMNNRSIHPLTRLPTHQPDFSHTHLLLDDLTPPLNFLPQYVSIC